MISQLKPTLYTNPTSLYGFHASIAGFRAAPQLSRSRQLAARIPSQQRASHHVVYASAAAAFTQEEALLKQTEEEIVQQGSKALELVSRSVNNVFVSLLRWFLSLWRMQHLFWLRIFRPKRPLAPSAAAAAAAAATPASKTADHSSSSASNASCNLVDPQVMGVVRQMEDPNTSHDDKWTQLECCMARQGDACRQPLQNMLSATGSHAMEVEQLRETTGVEDPSGNLLWGLKGTKQVLESEADLREALFQRIYLELEAQEKQKKRK